MTNDIRFSVSCQSISSAGARQLVEAAIAHAEMRGWRIAVAVVDVAGHIVALARMDGATAAVTDFAVDKAYTAAMARKTSLAFFERMASSAELAMGLANRPRLLCWEGGAPIRDADIALGGIGVSGATGPEDAECAAAALAQLGLR
jgi:glc operon protein GlcG